MTCRVFRSKIEKCKQFFEMVGFWSVGIQPSGANAQKRQIHPPGQISQFYPPGIIMTCRVINCLINCSKTLGRVAPKGRMFLIGFRSFSDKFEFYTRNHSHKQSSLLDTIFNYIFYFGAPGKYLYLSPQNPLSVGRRSRPRDSRFSLLFYRYFPGAPK